METKLHLIYSAGHAEEGHVYALYHTHVLLLYGCCRVGIEGRHGHERLQSLIEVELVNGEPDVYIVEEVYAVECLFQFGGRELVVEKGVAWKQV